MICKHCDGPIHKPESSIPGQAVEHYVHSDGWQQGKHTCPVDPYGFHAEPVGEPCGDHPANPCNGSQGLVPRAV